MSKKITAPHERGDDIPAIIAHLKKMGVAALLDRPFPTNGNGQGLRLGWTTVVGFAGMLSEGAPRRARVEPWGKAHLSTRRRCRARPVKPRDLADDRWATILASRCVAARWVACGRALKQSVLRVYDLQGRLGRVDTTTAAAYVTPAGLFQRGHSKEPRPDLPQGQIAMAVLEPLGVPLTSPVVAGNTADARLDLPAIAKGRPIAPLPGLPYGGDCKMAASGRRAESGAHQDFSLCPLAAKQMPAAELDRVRAPVLRGASEPRESRLPHADGVLDETAAPVALGVASTVELSALEHAGPSPTGQERRLVVRALAFAARQEKSVRQRGARAVTALNALDAGKHGQPRLPDEAGASPAAAAILAQQRVEGLVHVTVTTAGPTHVKRRYGIRPAPTVRRARGRTSAAREEAPRAHAVPRLGWRVSAPTHPVAERRRAQGGAAYRRDPLGEQGFGRLKGRSVSLTPRCVQYEHRLVGLLYLLSSALRGLVLIQCGVRRHLPHTGTTRNGIYPGQPGRQPAQPTTARLWSALRGVTLSQIKIDGKPPAHLTPLNAVQQRLLAWIEVPLELYGTLVA